MNEAKVLGVKVVKFNNPDTGEFISGRQVWLHAETPDPAWNGWEVFKVWCPDPGDLYVLASTLRVDDIVRLTMTRTGRVVGLALA